MIVKEKVWFHELAYGSWKYQLVIVTIVTLVTSLHIRFAGDFHFPVVVVSVLGTALAFFIGFVNNQAYSRWWEARRIWGAIINDSRSFGRMVMSFLTAGSGQEDDVRRLQEILMHRHFAFVYALKERLRDETKGEYRKYLSDSDQGRMGKQSHVPNAILLLQGQDIDEAEKAGYTDVFRMTQINEMLNAFSNHMGACERIKNTPFPIYYNTLIRSVVWVFVSIFPLVIPPAFGYLTILIGSILGAIYVLIHRSGQIMMNPFGTNPSATAMSSMSRTTDIPQPVKPIKGIYLL